MRFSKALRELRHEFGLSSNTMAEKLGVSPQRYSAWETGKTLPDLHMLEYICNALNVPPDIFFDLSIERPSVIEDVIYEAKRLSTDDSRLILGIIKRLRE
ncbi:MAG: helix-turn-helix transcriptional regulator [Eubacteriales bacterium]|nr:helix-turn-helix transcriptional regulator [Eubacteriales bacterium]